MSSTKILQQSCSPKKTHILADDRSEIEQHRLLAGCERGQESAQGFGGKGGCRRRRARRQGIYPQRSKSIQQAHEIRR